MNISSNNSPAPLGGRTLAAPSWVMPGTLHQNCLFLAGKVQEVGILCYECAASMAYTASDLPPELAGLPLSWHVHLPLDLDWAAPAEAAKNCAQIMRKLEFLAVGNAVLHPPKNLTEDKNIIASLALFVEEWKNQGFRPQQLLLENLPQHSVGMLARAATKLGCALCFDLSHYFMYIRLRETAAAARSMPGEDVLALAGLAHLCAPGANPSSGHHRPLNELTPPEAELAARICQGFNTQTVLMPEVFNWPDYTASLPILRAWLKL